jgi:hypothetical protein
MVSSQFSPWISQDLIKGDTIFETHLEFLIGLRIAHLKPFHLILKIKMIKIHTKEPAHTNTKHYNIKKNQKLELI